MMPVTVGSSFLFDLLPGGDHMIGVGEATSLWREDGDPLVFTIATHPNHGQLSGAPPNTTYFPNRDFDMTLSPERLFFHGPISADAVMSWTEAKRCSSNRVSTISISSQG